MFRNRFYYSIKPLLPWSIRIRIRRWFVSRKRRHVGAVWPICPGSEKPPEGWSGWPDGKAFAFVLTHDVEGPEGLGKVRHLAELEMSLGFRSCFNFIPEGPYRVPKELRDWLTSHSFEVGVHDLKHDGLLFRSRQDFARHASRINAHLQDWGATGFRAGFMLHQLEWLHDLNIQYDCSTFDTDPFEPQPHGQNTIFPFWVSQKQKPVSGEQKEQHADSIRQKAESGNQKQNRADTGWRSMEDVSHPEKHTQNAGGLGSEFPLSAFRVSDYEKPADLSSPLALHPSRLPRGYVELPYTLPQDSTLFLLLRERTPEIWLRKLDWVAQHGGLALVNVHPDYVRFDGEPASPRNYPVEHYAALLRHVRSFVQSSGLNAPSPSVSQLSTLSVSASEKSSFWHALPREVAAHVTTTAPRPVRRRPRRVCMVTHSFYAHDNRVIRYAESLAARGDQVDVLTLRSGPDTPRKECLKGVNVFHLHDRFSKQGESASDYLRPILRFFLSATWWITRHHGRQRYDLYHIHNIPDFLVFAAWYPRLRGARVILDIHDVVPEFFASKFSTPLNSWRIRLLLLMERWSARFAHHVIIANHLWLEKYVARSARADKCSVFINNVDAGIFRPVPRTRPDGRLIIMFPGGLQWHQGLDIGLRAFQKITGEFPQAEFHIYGDGNMKPQLVALAAELGLNGQVRFFSPLRVREIAAVMADADLGVVPKRADSFGNEAYSTKIMEFMSLGVPVVVSSTRIDRFYFNDSVVRFFESGNPDAMAEAMAEVLRDRGKREEMVARARDYAAQNSWETRKADYLNLVDSLCAR